MTQAESGGFGARHGRIGPAGRHRRAFEGAASPAPDEEEAVPLSAALLAADEGAEEGEEDVAELDLAGAKPSPPPASSPGLFLRDMLVVAALAIVVSMLVKSYLVRPYFIPSASMSETLLVDDHVLVNVLPVDWVGLDRGDVIVFRDPGGWLNVPPEPAKPPLRSIVDGALEAVALKPEDSSDALIKRIIGLPGDHVVCCNAYGQITINEMPVSEPYVRLHGHHAASGIGFDVVVPEGQLWVMGDNRYNSEDSRFHQDLPSRGFVPVENVVGRAFLVNWPLNRFSWLSSHPEVFAAVPNRDPDEQG